MLNRFLMLHPIRAIASSREDFKAEVERIYNIFKTENFCIEAQRSMICGSTQMN